MKRFAGISLLYVFMSGLSSAAPPGWWSDPATRVLVPGGEMNNQGPANVGQLKHFAKMAKAHLDAKLSGGAGSEINALVASFGTNLTPAQKAEQYVPANLGQLKKIAKPFFTRLLSAGYGTKFNLITRGYPTFWGYDTPWNPSTPVSENYAPASIGQLKMTFSFDLNGFDTDLNGFPDTWEQQYFGAIGINPLPDDDGDGQTNLQEFQSGSVPGKMDHPAVKLRVNVMVR